MPISIEEPNIDTDAEAMIDLSIQAYPFQLQSVEALRYSTKKNQNNPDLLSLVAKSDGEVIARAVAGPHEEMGNTDSGKVGIIVDHRYRGQGIGTRILDRVMPHVSRFPFHAVTSYVTGDDGMRFANEHGFVKTRTAHISRLNLADAAAAPPAPEGVQFRDFRQVDDPELIFELESAVVSDIPADEPIVSLPYEKWKSQFYDNPRNDMDSSIVAFDGDQAVGLTWQDRIGERIWTGMTGTLADHRGRGLAKAMKARSMALAHAQGAVVAYTDNDASNAPMLAVNRWLGYHPYVEQHTVVRSLT